MNKKVWHNCTVITMDPARSRARAFITSDDRIEFVGELDEALVRAGADAERIDLGGACVVPGFNDNHVHVVIFGDQAVVPSLAGKSSEEIVELLRARFPAPVPGELLIAYNWDYPACSDPHRSLLDRHFPANPVVLAQFGGHGLWLNSAALRLLGVGTPRENRIVGIIDRDEHGEPTGIVREVTNNPIIARHFRRTFTTKRLREPRIETALDAFRRAGITSIQDNTWFAPTISTYAALRRRGELSARISCWAHGEWKWSRPGMRFAPYDGTWVRRGPLKYFLDGTFTTRTAWLWDPYEGEPANHGAGMGSAAILPILRKLAHLRRQGAFHAIGDRSITEFLDAVEELYRARPDSRALRFRLEHAQLIRPRDIERLRALDVLVAAQPSALTTPEKDRRLLGRERAERSYPYRSLLDAGVQLSFGSDIPGEPIFAPIECIHLICNREGPERIDAEEALRCYTVGSAFAEWEEQRKGRIAPGMFADFAVLSDDLTTVARERIRDVRVIRTVAGGRTVFSA